MNFNKATRSTQLQNTIESWSFYSFFFFLFFFFSKCKVQDTTIILYMRIEL
jgi:hypothetical protein